MVWAGTGVLWAMSGGVPHSVGLIGDALAAEPKGFTFLQMSDSHVGFDKAANPDALGTLREAVAKVKAMKDKPSFIIHTGDITHLSKPAEFDNAQQVFSETGAQIHYVPGEHDIIDEDRGKSYLERYGKGSKGAGWYSFDDNGVHFVGLVNVVGSSIARQCDGGIYLHAGPEVSVASTKALTHMSVGFALLALALGRVRDLSFADGQAVERLVAGWPPGAIRTGKPP